MPCFPEAPGILRESMLTKTSYRFYWKAQALRAFFAQYSVERQIRRFGASRRSKSRAFLHQTSSESVIRRFRGLGGLAAAAGALALSRHGTFSASESVATRRCMAPGLGVHCKNIKGPDPVIPTRIKRETHHSKSQVQVAHWPTWGNFPSLQRRLVAGACMEAPARVVKAEAGPKPPTVPFGSITGIPVEEEHSRGAPRTHLFVDGPAVVGA